MLAQERFSSRFAVARRVCQEFGFVDACGRFRTSSCQAALNALERRGQVELPKPLAPVPNSGRVRGLEQPVPPPSAVPPRVEQIEGLHLVRVDHPQQRRTWNELVGREHPCGAVIHAGAQMRYLVVSEHGMVGALGFSAPALRLAVREHWLGWDETQCAQQLNQTVVNLSRFLIRPMVSCRNLGSKVLGLCLRRLPADFEERYGYRPLLVETFVDTRTHNGGVFAAAGFERVGETTGRGRHAADRTECRSVKSLWMRGLCRQWRRRLGVSPPPSPPPVLGFGEGLDRACWARNELGGAPLGDRRSSARLVTSAQVMSEQPGEPFTTAASGDRKLVAGHYRLIDKPADSEVNPQNILAPHRQRTGQRIGGCPMVAMVQDGTDLNFATHAGCGNLGVIGRNRKGAKGTLGLHLHSTLAIDADSGTPLGITRLEFDAPDGQADGSKPLEERKSARWLRGLRDLAQQAQPGVTYVAVMDREADIFAILAEARRLHKVELLVRAKVNRRLAADEAKLFEQLADRPLQGRLEIDLPRASARNATRTQRAKPLREARTVQADIRWGRFDIPPTREFRGESPVSMTLLSVCEPNPPEGVKPLCWLLLTSLPVDSLEQAVQVIDLYRLRWLIEDWHRILKSGCKAEEVEHNQAERIERVVAIKAVIAWRLLLMVALGRDTPELAAEVLFSDVELRVIEDFACQRKLTIKPEQLSGALTIMAVMGGYMHYRNAPPPGAKLLWKGYAYLSICTSTYERLIELNGEDNFYQLLRPDKDVCNR